MTVKQFIPKEHGTWAMLLVPLVIGFGAARRFGVKECLASVAILMFFLAQAQWLNGLRLNFSLNPSPRARSRIHRLCFLFGMSSILLIGPLLLYYHRAALILFGLLAFGLVVVSGMLVQAKKDRSIPGQALASAGLTLSAPVAYYVATGALARAAFQLWAVNFLFFLGGVSYVQMKIDALAQKSTLKSFSEKIRFARKTLLLETAVLMLFLFIQKSGPFSPRSTLALAPVLLQAIVGTWRLDHPPRLKRIGIISTVHSILFAALFIALA